MGEGERLADRLETMKRLRFEKARIRRQIRCWQQACNADGPNEQVDPELEPERSKRWKSD